jgi:hypothetical protein
MIAFVWWYVPAWLPKAPPHAKGAEFTAVTYNVLGHLVDPEQTFAVIGDTDADLVALEELRPTLQRPFEKRIDPTLWSLPASREGLYPALLPSPASRGRAGDRGSKDFSNGLSDQAEE